MIWFHILLLELTLLLFIYCYLLLSVWSELCPKGFELQFIGQMWYNNLEQKWWFVFQTKYSFKSICCYYISRLHTLLNEELIINQNSCLHLSLQYLTQFWGLNHTQYHKYFSHALWTLKNYLKNLHIYSFTKCNNYMFFTRLLLESAAGMLTGFWGRQLIHWFQRPFTSCFLY